MTTLVAKPCAKFHEDPSWEHGGLLHLLSQAPGYLLNEDEVITTIIITSMSVTISMSIIIIISYVLVIW